MNFLDKVFEPLIWRSRFVVLFAVVFSLGVSLLMFYMATVDAIYMIGHALHYYSPELNGAARMELRAVTVTHVVEIVDGYLLASVMLIFALGLYELFISEIDIAKESANGNEKISSNVLMITSLDDLKTRLAKVILMILIVRFFEQASGMEFHGALDLLMFAGGVALLGLALFLAHAAEKK